MIFSLKILKNYIVRCDFWSWRHFVDRLKFFYFCTVNIVTLCGGNVYSNVFDTAVKADVFRRYLFRIVEIIHIIKRIAGKFRYVCVNAVYAFNAYFRSYFSVTHIDCFNINVVIVTACGVVQFLHNRLFVDCSVCGFAIYICSNISAVDFKAKFVIPVLSLRRKCCGQGTNRVRLLVR